MSYDTWKTREDPEPHSEHDCRYCEETDRSLLQQIEINTALRDVLADLVSILKPSIDFYPTLHSRIIDALTEAETILGDR